MKNVSAKTFWLCILAGVAIRFLFMQAGYNYDFESYCVVGDLAAAGKNVYANTHRYNYGPVWFTLLGLFWKISSCFTRNILVFRALIVSTLTLADFLIARLIAKRAGNFWGALFFLNPISLIITGYHNQFDNIAVLLAALAVSFIEKSCEASAIKTEDLCGTALLSLSMITKHILWAFPVWLLMNMKINPRKKFIYAFVPPILFLMSFAPYWREGADGIISNVFLYKSYNNFPLFAFGVMNHFGISIPFQEYICLPAFGLLMAATAYIFRNKDIYESFMLYTIVLVCVSSAIANQYVAIPCMAMVLVFRGKSAVYFLVCGIFLLFSNGGLHLAIFLNNHYGIDFNIFTNFLRSGSIMYTSSSWCLLCYLIHYYRNGRDVLSLQAEKI